MFPYSTQKKFWMFFDENEINHLREKANTTFILKHGQNLPVLFITYKFYNYFYEYKLNNLFLCRRNNDKSSF